MTPRERLWWLRRGPRAEAITTLAFLLGVGLGAIHWLGLVAGGMLLGLLAPSFRRAVVMGLYLGGTVAVAFVAWLALFGALDAAVATGRLFWFSIGLAVGLPTLGSSIRGLG